MADVKKLRNLFAQNDQPSANPLAGVASAIGAAAPTAETTGDSPEIKAMMDRMAAAQKVYNQIGGPTNQGSGIEAAILAAAPMLLGTALGGQAGTMAGVNAAQTGLGQYQKGITDEEALQKEKVKQILGFGGDIEKAHAQKGESELQRKKLEYEMQKGNKELSLKEKELNAKENKPEKPTSDQSKAALFGTRMEQAENQMRELANSGFNRASTGAGISSILPNVMKPEASQQQDQAERNFVNAVLRRESGAAISPSEFQSAEAQYFPRAGDSPKTLQQKEQNRMLAIAGMKTEAGPAYASLVKESAGSMNPVASANVPSGEGVANAAPLPPAASHPEAQKAIEWAKANPKDPRSKAIMERFK